MSVHNSLGDLKLDQTVFFLCDMQERFRPAIKFFSDIVEVAKRLVLVFYDNRCSVYRSYIKINKTDVPTDE